MADIKLKDLRYLVAVADTGHFGKAAAECAVSQPTLSTQVAKAEEVLGAVLFDRRSRPVQCTAPGTRLVALAVEVLTAHERLLAAAAVGIEPLDMPFFDFHDDAGLEREALEAAEVGFTGKAAIHPAQVPIINRVFIPTPEEVAEANALLAAATEAFARGQAAFVFQGAMVDAPHINRARKIVARAASAPATP